MEMSSQEMEERPVTTEPVEQEPETGMDQMEEKKKMVVQMCTCERCPSYKDCTAEGGERELGFCFPGIGKSKCIAEEKGCICANCPVTAQMQLKNLYFCTKGSEKEQVDGAGQVAESSPAETPAESQPAASEPEEPQPASSEPEAERPVM
jgi:hypothetical protein